MPVIDLIYPTAEHTPTPSPSLRPQTPSNVTIEATDSASSSPEMRVIDLVYPTGHTPPKEPSPTPPPHEKRLRRHHATAPYSFDKVYQRALTQRFYVLQRTPCGTEDCPAESFEMTGSTGNIYTVHINREPSCDCPHALGGNQCKHVIFILAKVLQAPVELVYQDALLSSELRSIFEGAPSGLAAREEGGSGRKLRVIVRFAFVN
ncbi:Znf1 [Pochonia chlamydosporia 170]|uniref:Znf1 n=1 Tax=Pochonia chlamydosporia 170 TaxID=1380566 RepID=A0A179FBR7_METCM|nr:Znf1 [Pochonia chlamydosporia 170]OAQ63005.1 Znf1 [Pochonia chlamydosporia 170]